MYASESGFFGLRAGPDQLTDRRASLYIACMPPEKVPVVLTIAGFDPSSGAGITADLKTIAAHGCYGVAAITALTVQNTQGVSRVEPQSVDLLRETLAALAEDSALAAIKVGMLGSAARAEVVAEFLSWHPNVPVVLDPILRSSSGAELVDAEGIKILTTKLLRLSTVITPNMDEAAALTGQAVRTMADMRSAAKEFQSHGAKNVVITGGHSRENVDLLVDESGKEFEFAGPKLESDATHGTGCAFSTALACGLAKGHDLKTAVKAAKEYVRQAIHAAYPVGKGAGPMNHLFRLK